jgi:hypothetical protein
MAIIFILSIFPISTISIGVPTKSLKMSAEEDLLIDKVYTFMAPSDTIYFDNSLFLEKNYNYYISVKIVTPHICNMEISLWDPEDARYDIFYKENMTQGEDFEIPFGVALEGNYSAKFSVKCNKTLNVYIAMEKGGKCLQDIISIQDWDNKVLYKVIKFDNSSEIEEHLYCKTDTYYTFYIGRVSAIAVNLSNSVSIDYIINDPENTSFNIYGNNVLEIINSVNKFKFGTAIEGVYILDMAIYCEVKYVNVAYAIIKGPRISEILDPNTSDPDPTNITESNQGIFSLSSSVIAGASILVLIVIGVSIIAVIIHKKQNPIALNIKKFNPKKD